MLEFIKAYLLKKALKKKINVQNTYMQIFSLGGKYIGVRVITPWGRTRDFAMTFDDSTRVLESLIMSRQDVIDTALSRTPMVNIPAPGTQERGN